MLVLGDKEDRRNDCGGWRDWAVGPDGIELSSAGTFVRKTEAKTWGESID